MKKRNLRIHVIISGKVQNVFFRQTLKTIAIKNNVRGWTKNLDDGSVEAIIEGAYGNVFVVINWCHRGPANAIVEKVKTKSEKYTGKFKTFDVLY
ncbi:MAG: acylphosphatase [Thaumarchaeota archaeon]|nr:acylphosphatase [Nitrososphaerota archaeon]